MALSILGITSDSPTELSIFAELLYIRQICRYTRRVVGFGGSWSEDLARNARDSQRNCRFALTGACIPSEDDEGKSAGWEC